jgi:hypothetical protein
MKCGDIYILCEGGCNQEKHNELTEIRVCVSCREVN